MGYGTREIDPSALYIDCDRRVQCHTATEAAHIGRKWLRTLVNMIDESHGVVLSERDDGKGYILQAKDRNGTTFRTGFAEFELIK